MLTQEISCSAFSPEVETKYTLLERQAHSLLLNLQARCFPDGQYPEAKVSSIYFDTLDWQFAEEKANSDFLKTKVRLRWYGGLDDSIQKTSAMAEVKYRVGGTRKKLRVPSDFSPELLEKIDLSDPRLLEIPSLLREYGFSLSKPIFPVFVVTYFRFRFFEPMTGARLSLDFNIKALRGNTLRCPFTSDKKLSLAVLEIKNNNLNFPKILSMAMDLGAQKSSFSKYYSCFQAIRGTQ